MWFTEAWCIIAITEVRFEKRNEEQDERTDQREQRAEKKRQCVIILVLFMCVLATVAAVILISSPTVSVQYKDIGGVVIDKQHAMIAAVAAVLSGIAAFAVRHHQEF